MLLPHLAGATLDVAMREAEGEHGPFEELFHDCKAHYLPLLSCLRYLLARDERGHRGLNQAQVWQVALAMQRVEIAVLLCLRTAPLSARLLTPKAQAAPTYPGAPCERLGGLLWHQLRIPQG